MEFTAFVFSKMVSNEGKYQRLFLYFDEICGMTYFDF